MPTICLLPLVTPAGSLPRPTARSGRQEWTGIDYSLSGVAYFVYRRTFAAVGQAGTVVTSKDGMEWKDESSGVGSYLWGVARAARTLVAVGDNGTIITSPDSTTWSQKTCRDKQWSLWSGLRQGDLCRCGRLRDHPPIR